MDALALSVDNQGLTAIDVQWYIAASLFDRFLRPPVDDQNKRKATHDAHPSNQESFVGLVTISSMSATLKNKHMQSALNSQNGDFHDLVAQCARTKKTAKQIVRQLVKRFVQAHRILARRFAAKFGLEHIDKLCVNNMWRKRPRSVHKTHSAKKKKKNDPERPC